MKVPESLPSDTRVPHQPGLAQSCPGAGDPWLGRAMCVWSQAPSARFHYSAPAHCSSVHLGCTHTGDPGEFTWLGMSLGRPLRLREDTEGVRAPGETG